MCLANGLRLKKHEVWFRNRGGDDRWLDEFGVDAEALQEDAVKTTEESEQAGKGYVGHVGIYHV